MEAVTVYGRRGESTPNPEAQCKSQLLQVAESKCFFIGYNELALI